MADITLLDKYDTYEEELMGHVESITAFAGGGQTNATALTYKWNTVDTCATDLDSVKLILSKQGYKQVIFNNTAKTVAVYPVLGESVNGAANLSVSILAGESAVFTCVSDGEWNYSISSQSGLEFTGSLTVSSAQIKALNSSPLTMVPAIPNYACQLQSLAVRFAYFAPVYTGGGGMEVITDTGTNEQSNIPGIDGSTTFLRNYNAQFNANNGDLVVNKALLLSWASSNPINGNGTAVVYYTYRLFTP